MTRGLILAVQFLTRLPVPRLEDFRADDLSRSSVWFPAVGAAVGTVVAALLALGALIDPWLGALLALIAWVWITGALHLDGLADLVDALGASHRDSRRFLEVLRDPHIGTFGVIALVLAMAAKFVLLTIALKQSASPWIALPLIAAWARLGAIVWSRWLPALAAGSAQRFAWTTSKQMLAVWGVVLIAASTLLSPALALAPAVIAGWGLYLKRKIGGMTGDCLGAGIEVTEIVLLALLVVSTRLPIVNAWA